MASHMIFLRSYVQTWLSVVSRTTSRTWWNLKSITSRLVLKMCWFKLFRTLLGTCHWKWKMDESILCLFLNVFYFLVLGPINVIFLFETGSMQSVFSHHCGMYFKLLMGSYQLNKIFYCFTNKMIYLFRWVTFFIHHLYFILKLNGSNLTID